MKKIIIFIYLLSLAGIMIHPAMSSPIPVEIRVTDGMTPAPKANVEIWCGSALVLRQTTDSYGVFETYLDDKKKYKICASKGEQYNCIDTIPTSRINIDIGDSVGWNSLDYSPRQR